MIISLLYFWQICEPCSQSVWCASQAQPVCPGGCAFYNYLFIYSFIALEVVRPSWLGEIMAWRPILSRFLMPGPDKMPSHDFLCLYLLEYGGRIWNNLSVIKMPWHCFTFVFVPVHMWHTQTRAMSGLVARLILSLLRCVIVITIIDVYRVSQKKLPFWKFLRLDPYDMSGWISSWS